MQYVYMVMVLNEGGDLEALLERHGRFSERAAAAVMYECLKIISVCHSNGAIACLACASHKPALALEGAYHPWISDVLRAWEVV